MQLMRNSKIKLNWRDALTFLLFFILSAAIWYGHAMRSVRNTHVPVLIQYTGKPGSIALEAKGLPDTVIIEVRDAGQRLNGYLQEALHLTIDLRPYIHGDRGTIHVPSDALRRSISNILQGTSSLIDTKPEELTCSYFTEKEKTVPIIVDCEAEPANEYLLVGDPKPNRTKMKIYGDERELSKIDTLYTRHTLLTNLTDTTDVRVALDIPHGIRAEEDSINLRYIAERFTEKKFLVPIRVKGVPEGYSIRLFPDQVEVNVRVFMRLFSQVQAKDIQAVCIYTPERVDRMEVELNYTNPSISTVWAYPSVVEFVLEQ